MPRAGGDAARKASHGSDDMMARNPDAEGYSAPPVASQAVSGDGDMTTTIATIGIVAVGVALIEVSLIPGMLIGLAAAFAPKFVPKLGDGFRPLLKQTVRGAYKMAQKTREAVAEAGEQMQDLVAEARAEEEHEAAAARSGEAGSSAQKS